MAPVWKSHLEALGRFNQWETEQFRERPADFGRALAWLSEAWELADRYGAGTISGQVSFLSRRQSIVTGV